MFELFMTFALGMFCGVVLVGYLAGGNKQIWKK